MSEPRRSLAYNFGAFLGHIVGAVRSRPGGQKQTVRELIEEEERDGVVLRRTTIEEVEFTGDRPSQASADPPAHESDTP